MKYLLPLLLLLSACAQTPQGRSIDRSNNVDLGTTVAGLMSGAVEANPLMPYVIPAKWLMGRYIDTRPCESRVRLASSINPVFYGASANNIAVAAGLGFPYAPIIGLATGIWYYWLGYHLEPGDVWGCE